jgi:hypothetical protein
MYIRIRSTSNKSITQWFTQFKEVGSVRKQKSTENCVNTVMIEEWLVDFVSHTLLAATMKTNSI